MSDFQVETIEPTEHTQKTPLLEAIETALRTHYGLSGVIEGPDPMGAGMNTGILVRNGSHYTIDNGHMRYRIDLNDADGTDELELQAAVLRHLAQKPDAPDAPEPVTTRDGLDVVALEHESGQALRLLIATDGTAFPDDRGPMPGEILGVGELAGTIALCLADLDDPRLDHMADTDLRQAGPVVLRLLGDVVDHDVRDPIAKVLVAALRRVQPLGPLLRSQAVHNGLLLDRLTGRTGDDGEWKARGIIDAAGVTRSWLVGSLAITLTDLIRHGSDDPFAILPAVRAFHETYPLTEPELKALWSLIVARACVLAAQAENSATSRAASPHEDENIEAEHSDTVPPADNMAGPELSGRRVFAIVTDVHPSLMDAAILDAADWDSGDPSVISDEIVQLLPEIDTSKVRLVDLGIDSPLLNNGNWADQEIDWRLLARTAWETHMGATRYGEYRLSRSVHADLAQTEMENFALHVDICVPAGSVVVAPFGGTLVEVGQQLVLVGRDATLYLEGLVCPLSAGMTLFAEDAIGSVAGAEGAVGGLRIRLCRDPDLSPPLFSSPSRAGAWRRLAPSPSQLLGLDVDAPQPHRNELVRGWRALVYDGTGNSFVDLSGAAGIVGHGHPALANAAYLQWSLLSGSSTLASERRFREAMLKILPQGLDIIAAIGTEAEMIELAHGLARNDERQQTAFFDLEGDESQPAPALFRIADETETGFGRNGHAMWAFETQETLPDVLVTGSILPGKPLAILATRSDIAADMTERPAPAADAADFAIAAAALNALTEDDLPDNARIVGQRLHDALREIERNHAVTVTGEGLSLDLVFDQSIAEKIAKNLLAQGFLTETVDDPQRLRLRPPLCIDSQMVDRLVQALSKCLSMIANDRVITREQIDEPSPLSGEAAIPI